MGGAAVVKRRVWVIATDSAGCYYYRLHLPLTFLNQEEFEVIWRPGDGERQPGDIVIGQRIAGYNQAWLDMCADPTITTIYDLDDDLLGIDPGNAVPYSIYAPQVEGTGNNIMAADAVTVSTKKLAEKIGKLNPNTFYLPNCVHPRSVQSLLPDRPFTVGWAGSMFHGQDMGGLSEQIRNFHRMRPDTRWHFIGANYSDGAVPTSVSPWQSIQGYEATLDFSVGMAILADTPFNRYKSWIKVLEYASKGIPAVASNVGQYPEFIFHEHNGHLLNNIGELAGTLEYYADYHYRAEIGEAALTTARMYTIDRHVTAWEEVYREAAPC
jgi:hypothetical protein